MIRTITVSLIILLSLLSLYFFTTSNKLAFYTTILINITVITFSILLWLEDREHKEEVSQRVISFPVKEMIKDIVYKQANMLKAEKVLEKEGGFEIYKGKHTIIRVEFEKDEKGNILTIDGKYIARIEAPEYILQNIDQEIWSHIGRKA